LFIKTIIDAKPWYKEPSLLPFPWKDAKSFVGKKLKVAVLWDDGVVKPHPPVTRALKQVEDKLKAKDNVEVVEWKPYKHDLAWELIVPSQLSLFFLDFANYARQIYTLVMVVQRNLQRSTRPENLFVP
jgi:Asp-tRNA(Asn)/Glu-tRNA(Gln) amidotransferase A subunit family amidase